MTSPRPILFLCASDTLVRLLLPVAKAVQARGRDVAFATLQFTSEAAEFELGSQVPRAAYVGAVRHQAAWLARFDAIVMGNDWGREVRALILQARQAGVPTLCVQESVINLTDVRRRMRFADHVLVQGAVSARMLADRERIHVTGNPRYEHLAVGPAVSGAPVLLNCNFTYGVEEDNRHAWLSSAIGACDAQRRPVTILQHPRDVADLGVYGKPVIRTSAATIHDRLRQGAVVVTRFSSLIHEAIALGRPAVYFNPHQEDVGYDFGDECAVLRHARDQAGLERALADLASAPPTDASFVTYLREHIRPTETLPSEACAEVVVALAGQRPNGSGGADAAPAPRAGDGLRRLGLLGYVLAERLYLVLRGRL
jgi:hypothetical protein